MNIVTYNIRGGKSSQKRRRIHENVMKGGAKMWFLQETKLQWMNDALMRIFWANIEVNWSAKAGQGLLGGFSII